MKQLNRYQLDISNVEYKYPLEMSEDPDGDYVLYVDVTDEIDRLRAQVEALKELLGDARAAIEWPSIETYREQVVANIDKALRGEEDR